VGIIFGGRSGEHEVSLMSAQSVMKALDPEKYDVVMIGIDRKGRWLTGDVMAALATGANDAARPAALLPDPRTSALLEVEMGQARSASFSEVSKLDVVFPVLHGPYGEDGTVQGLLELAGIPYVGAGVVGSAVGMDKGIFKSVMQSHDLPVLPWRLVLASEWKERSEDVLDGIEEALAYPVFTKPANLGSSVGVSKCRDRDELATGVAEAARYDRRIVVEQGIDARELEVSVLGNDDPIASVIGEVRPRRDYYDYVAKYISDDSELIIPARLESSVADEVRILAVKAFRAIDCAGMARADFLLDKANGRVYVNELNTIPGFTRISMYPKLWEATGVNYAELLNRLIELALERREVTDKLETSFEVNGNG
jgi:D-alanine-D-alanine ligase